MTVANTTNRTSAVGSAAVGQEVPFSFPTTDTSDLLVKKRITATGVETTLFETTNYTVEISGDIGGTVTTVTAIAATEQIHIIRNTPKTQSLDLEQGGSFNAENIEDALDKNTKLIIENHDKLTNKAITFPETDPSLTTILPSAIDRASKNLTFDASGNVTASASVEEGSVSFSTFGTNMAEAANALAGKAVINLDQIYDIRDYNATADGSTDDTIAVQAVIDAAEVAGGGIVEFPAGITIVSNIIVNSSYVFLRGQGWRATYIKAKAGTVGSIVTFDGTDYDNRISNNGIRNLTIWGNSTSTKGLSLKHLNLFRVDQVDITGCLDDGFYAEQVWDSTFIQFKVNNCGAAGKAAIHIYNGGETYCDQLNFYAPYIEANTGYDIWVDASNAAGESNKNILFHRMHLERTAGSGETLAYISGTKGNEKIMFTSSGFSGYDADYAIHCDAGGSPSTQISGCKFWNRSNRGTAILLETGRHQVNSNLFHYWDYDIDYQNLAVGDLSMWDNRRQALTGARIAQIGPSGVWSWSKQAKSYEPISLTDGDTTPSIKLGTVFVTANTAATTYTNLDDGSQNETIVIIFGDSLTKIDFSSNVYLYGNDGADWRPKLHDSMICTYRTGKWHCIVSNSSLSQRILCHDGEVITYENEVLIY